MLASLAASSVNDQPFWAAGLTAPGAIPWRRLTPARLAAALITAVTTAVTDPAHRRRARALAVRVAAEDGAAPVVEAVNRRGCSSR
ncbi:hypothetical protein [Nonomuraea harbinensis]|uniref:Uncharacterized protein n=1 Tax=Nonomuraea harbinensis TaxID=1286938 RepID=A0ABW1C345_9ACTN|nr:hypothetical protein [Nonomuraea harbinensis]